MIRFFKYPLLVLLISIFSFGATAQALSDDDLNSIYNDTVWYDPNSGLSCSPGSALTDNGSNASSDLTFPNMDQGAMVTGIIKYIKSVNPQSVFLNNPAGSNATINALVNTAQSVNVNPFLVIGIAQQESQLGDPSDFNVKNANNSFGRTATDSQPHVDGAKKWYKWVSPKASVDYTDASNHGDPNGDQLSYMRQVYGSDIGTGNLTDIMKDYAPASDGNAPVAYAEAVKQRISTMTDLSGGSDSSAATNDNRSIDLTSLSKKYNLQSAIIKQVGGGLVDTYNADDHPNSPASVLKLIIAHAFLSTNPDLNKQVTVQQKEVYSPPGDSGDFNPKAGSKLSLRTALEQMLTYSSDTDANVIIDATGGLDNINALATKLGYKSTGISAYYSDSATTVANHTTVTDLTSALENIFTGQGSNYQAAQMFLSSDKRNTFGIDSDASKWGGVPGVLTHKPATGNSALFSIGASKYIVTMYINEPYTGDDSPAVGRIRDATNQIVSLLRTSSNSGTSKNSGSVAASCSSSCVNLSGDVASFVQALAAKESGGNPTVVNSAGAKGKYQYMDGTWQSNAKSYYGPGIQYSHASDAPEAVQDAVAYIEYSVKYSKYGGDLFKMAVSHYYPIANTDPSKLDVVPPGNTESPRQYAQNFIDGLNSGKGKDIPLKFTEAPDFASWYAKSVGKPYAPDAQSSSLSSCGGTGVSNFIFYSQGDDKWKDHPYGTSTIAESGCGPTSVAEVVATLSNRSITPVEAADFGTKNGAYITGTGSSHQKMLIDGPEHWGLHVKPLGTDLTEAANIIKNGGLVIAAGQGQHPFSTGGHVIVLRALDSSGRFLIGNPAPNLQDSQDQPFSATDLTGAGLQALYGVTK